MEFLVVTFVGIILITIIAFWRSNEERLDELRGKLNSLDYDLSRAITKLDKLCDSTKVEESVPKLVEKKYVEDEKRHEKEYEKEYQKRDEKYDSSVTESSKDSSG